MPTFSHQACLTLLLALLATLASGADSSKPYSPPCVEREEVFEFTEKPVCRSLGEDKYEIGFAVKANCDVTVGIVDEKGTVVRHLGAGVLGSNAPQPFQKNALKQTIHWNGKDDLDEYVKEPGRLRVQVALGLKPVFHKRLGGNSPKNIPGCVIGLAVGPEGAYVVSRGMACSFGNETIRRFDRDGRYLGTISPPPAGLSEAQLGGMGYIEFEPGKKALQGPDINSAVAVTGFYLPTSLDADWVASCQPVVAGNRLVFANGGEVWGSSGSFLHYIGSDGSTDARGIQGLKLAKGTVHQDYRLAASPDGKTIYLSGAQQGGDRGLKVNVFARSLDGDQPGRIFAGDPGKPGSGGVPGSDNAHLNGAEGIDCDAEGRVYVADSSNNRIQVFAPEGKHLKTIPCERPNLICVHKKSGAIYVLHNARVEGRSVSRVTKLRSFADPAEELHADGLIGLMALDSWSPQPRLWFSGMQGRRYGHGEATGAIYEGSGSVTLWEEREKRFVKLADFESESLKEGGTNWPGRWNGVGTHILGFANATCDPNRERMYYRYSDIFNLVTGEWEGSFQPQGGCFADISFDRRGYLHGHQNNRAGIPCVWRADPAREILSKGKEGQSVHQYPECPYDYGEEVSSGNWKGALPTRCQAGAKGFQDGMGVNMKGEIAVASNIYYVPKMEEAGREAAMAGSEALTKSGRYNEEGGAYAASMRTIENALKKGEEVYFVKRQPGIPLTGSTLWTFDRTGEMRKESPAILGGLLNGLQLDEEQNLHFTMDRSRLSGGKPFLDGMGGHFGAQQREGAFTGTHVKTRLEQLKIQLKNSLIPIDAPPKRPPDFNHTEGWIEGAQWLYAGASGIVAGVCSCWSSRFHLDWYKRSYIPELYRHSVGILDDNGNLILHLGRYGNFDSAPGGKDGAQPGGSEIGMAAPRYIGGTDRYLAIPDRGEWITVLKLEYHATEAASIGVKR